MWETFATLMTLVWRFSDSNLAPLNPFNPSSPALQTGALAGHLSASQAALWAQTGASSKAGFDRESGETDGETVSRSGSASYSSDSASSHSDEEGERNKDDDDEEEEEEEEVLNLRRRRRAPNEDHDSEDGSGGSSEDDQSQDEDHSDETEDEEEEEEEDGGRAAGRADPALAAALETAADVVAAAAQPPLPSLSLCDAIMALAKLAGVTLAEDISLRGFIHIPDVLQTQSVTNMPDTAVSADLPLFFSLALRVYRLAKLSALLMDNKVGREKERERDGEREGKGGRKRERERETKVRLLSEG
jgi:hypothetical protein